MEYAAQRYKVPSRRSLLAPLVALIAGAGIAVGGFALFDDETTVQSPDKVVFVDTPSPGEGVRGIDDMAKVPTSQGVEPKHETSTAAAIGAGSGSQSGDVKDEASTAAAIGAGSGSQDADSANRTDPHGPAAQLHLR